MVLFSTFFFVLFISLSLSQGQPPIDPLEQKALYDVLNSLNPAIPWTTDYPDDLCLSAPHGVVCDYHPSDSDDHNVQNQQQKAHAVELNFGYVSDETPNPPCSPKATLNPLLFTSFPYLQKFFFYKCFNNTQNPLLSFPRSTLFPQPHHQFYLTIHPTISNPLSSLCWILHSNNMEAGSLFLQWMQWLRL